MILSQFVGAGLARYPATENILQASRARRPGGKMAQKGDFAEVDRFAIASTNYTNRISRLDQQCKEVQNLRKCLCQ
jgi:hypothetical protein